MELLQNFYETTLEALKDAKNDRLWFKTNTKLGKLYFDRNDFGKLQKILKQLHQSCQVIGDEHIFFIQFFRIIRIFFRLTMVKMIWRKVHNCWKFMRWKSRCIQFKRITKSSKHSMNNHCTSSPLFRIHWSWALFEVSFLKITIHHLCTELPLKLCFNLKNVNIYRMWW